jgi:hypothetical protein
VVKWEECISGVHKSGLDTLPSSGWLTGGLTSARLSVCPNVPMSQCPNVPMFRCLGWESKAGQRSETWEKIILGLGLHSSTPQSVSS